MKLREYLKCTITSKDGSTYTNPLKLSEAHLIPSILKEQKSISIERVECTPEYYKSTFGS
jgi:hypothetical protein